jgi:dienelactone hydrolase
MPADFSLSLDRRRFLRTASFTALSTATARLFADDAHPTTPRTVEDDLRTALEDPPLTMLFEGTTAEECRRWQAEFRGRLEQLLGPSTAPESWETVEESRTELGDHTRLELLLRAPGLWDLPVYLLLPKDDRSAARRPAVVCVHGHGDFGHHPIVGRTDLEGVAAAIEKAHYDYGLQFVRRGYVVAAPCLVPFGRRVQGGSYKTDDPCAITFIRMAALGQLPITSNLRDIRWAISLLQQRPEVRDDRIGCVGLSYGGRMTMLSTAMDERIRAAAVSGALNMLQERARGKYSCGSQMIPGLLNYGDYPEIASLIAPRPCVWEVGSQDKLMVAGWRDVFRERMELAYAALGAADQLQFDNFEGGHQWHGDVAYPLFERVLKS